MKQGKNVSESKKKKKKVFDPGRPLRTRKHEEFCQALIRDNKTQTQAYQVVYGQNVPDEVARVNASRLLTTANVKKRIDFLRDKIAKKHEVTLDLVVQGLLEEARHKGSDTNHIARVQAWKHLGQFTGGFDKNVSKHEVNIGSYMAEKLQLASSRLLKQLGAEVHQVVMLTLIESFGLADRVKQLEAAPQEALEDSQTITL